MLRFLGFIFVVTLAVAAWGWYRGWYSISGRSTDDHVEFTLDVDKGKLAQDLDSYEQKLRDGLNALDRKIDGLKEKAKQAKGSAKASIETEIEELKQTKQEAADSLDRLRSSTAETAAQAKGKAADAVRNIQETLGSEGGKPADGPSHQR